MAKDKDAFWFKHDSNSGRGLRLKKLQAKFGHWGKGVYWDVIEVLREQSGYKYEHAAESVALLGEMIGVKPGEDFKSFFAFCVDISLFKLKGNYFSSEVLTNNMKNWETKKANGSKGGRPKTAEKKNRKKTETKADRNHKRREEERIEEKIIGDFFKVNGQVYRQKVSDFFLSNFQSYYEQWLMKHDPDLAPAVLEKLDTDYHSTDFGDLNHIRNAFKTTWEKLEKAASFPARNRSTNQTENIMNAFNQAQKNLNNEHGDINHQE